MKISTQSKYFLIFLIYILIGFLIGIILMATQFKPLILVFFGWMFVAKYLLDKVKCPSCEMPVSYQGKMLGIPFYAGVCRRKCANCGYDLSQELENKK